MSLRYWRNLAWFIDEQNQFEFDRQNWETRLGVWQLASFHTIFFHDTARAAHPPCCYKGSERAAPNGTYFKRV
jgi:hypothetical protein